MLSKRVKENFISYGFLAPFLAVFLIFLAYPVIYSMWLSLHKTTIYTSWYAPFDSMKYIGMGHYINILTDVEFWWSICLTFCYGFLTIPTGIMLSLLLAIFLNNCSKR